MTIKSRKRKNFKALRTLGFSYKDSLYLIGKFKGVFPDLSKADDIICDSDYTVINDDNYGYSYYFHNSTYSFKGIKFSFNGGLIQPA